MKEHVMAWNRIWQSRFDLTGNCNLSSKIHSAYYYLLSSMAMSTSYEEDGWPFFGISPNGLINMNGHVSDFCPFSTF